jgi:hypothetical protein
VTSPFRLSGHRILCLAMSAAAIVGMTLQHLNSACGGTFFDCSRYRISEGVFA